MSTKRTEFWGIQFGDGNLDSDYEHPVFMFRSKRLAQESLDRDWNPPPRTRYKAKVVKIRLEISHG